MKLFKVFLIILLLPLTSFSQDLVLNYEAYQMDVYSNNKFENSYKISDILEFKGNHIRTSNNEQLKYFYVESWKQDNFILNYGPVPTLVAQLKDHGGFDCMMSMLYEKQTDQTIITFGYKNMDVMLYCKPTKKGIDDDKYVPLKDHYISKVNYSDEEILEFFNILGDPKIIEFLIIRDILN